MEMQDRADFDSAWEKAFADAEMDVSPNLWEKVERDVIIGSNKKYKKRLLLFQILAAASVAFALSVGGVGIYQLYIGEAINDQQKISKSNVDATVRGNVPVQDKEKETRDQERLAKIEERNSSSKRKIFSNRTNSENNRETVRETVDAEKKSAPDPVNKNKKGDVHSKNPFVALSEPGKSENNNAGEKVYDPIENKRAPMSGGALNNNDRLSAEPDEVDRVFEYLETRPLAMTELRMVPWYSYIPEKKPQPGGIWAGVGFSAGSFDPNATSGSAPAQMQTLAFDANSRRTPSFTQEKAGQAINMGINVGTKVAEKWVLQSGIVYIQQQTTSTSNVVSTTREGSVKALSNFAEIARTEEIAFTAPYDVNNTYELISIPLQAGYILLDRKFNITLLGGVSNNILLKNQIGSTSGDFGEAEISSGSESRYRTYQLSGMFGSEFSYEIGNNYSLSIVPQIRQALNSTTKPEADYRSRPTTLEIGFRLKYNLNR